MDALSRSASILRKWCVGKALPLWAELGQNPDGSWVEHLHLNGTADHAAERRWRVLARQVYVYSMSSALGWFDGEAIAISTYQKMSDIGFVHRVDADGKITNAKRDLYDHAFYVLAASSLYELTGDSKYLQDAETLMSWIETSLCHPFGGWRESDQVDDGAPRRQNPHMHLLEASLFLHRVSKDPKHLKFAQMVFDLFEIHFFQDGAICEFFESNWTVEPGYKGETVEPGHMMEWIWLLGQYGAATGENVAHYQSALYQKALHNRGWFLNDEESKLGVIRRKTKRLWVQTEVIKAHLAMAESGVPGSREMAAETIIALFPTFLTTKGLWNDQINAHGANIAKTIPVSTFYHILCMAKECERVASLP